eukprot:scaffold198857_cov19-Tisochrysis_lutea.AAC.2
MQLAACCLAQISCHGYAVELQIIHTDLKPENVMLCQPLHDRTWILPDPAELAAAAAQRKQAQQAAAPRCGVPPTVFVDSLFLPDTYTTVAALRLSCLLVLTSRGAKERSPTTPTNVHACAHTHTHIHAHAHA